MRNNTILAGVGGAAVMGAVLGIGYLLFKGGPDPQLFILGREQLSHMPVPANLGNSTHPRNPSTTVSCDGFTCQSLSS